MKALGHMIRRHRLDLGSTQVDVARRAGVSLATLQNIEAGRANPSVSTLAGILREVAISTGWQATRPDWDELCALGLPLTGAQGPDRVRTADRLAHALLPALLDVARRTGSGREAEALKALLLALKLHFPGFWTAHLSRSPLAKRMVAPSPAGREIKLYRIARAALAEYL